MYYDTREEFGNLGLTDSIDFTRDEFQYTKSAFKAMDLTVIDIWPAIDITRDVANYETILSTFIAVFSIDHYDIAFDIGTLTDTEAYAIKELGIDTYGDKLIENAYSNPVEGIIENPIFYRKKVSRRKSNKSDKISAEVSLKEVEKNEAKTDEKLSGYEVKISDDQDKAITNLYKLSGVDNIMSFDVAAENWTIWVPPV